MASLDRAINLAEKGRLKFVVPPAFPWAPGHYIHDVHCFFLEVTLRDPLQECIYLYPFHEAEIPFCTYSLIKNYVMSRFPNVKIVLSSSLVYEVGQIALLYPEYVVCPNSPICRLVIPNNVSKSECRLGSSLLGLRYYSIPTREEQRWIVDYLEKANKIQDCNPFWGSQENFLDHKIDALKGKKIALIQAKKELANTGIPINYTDYRELVEYLMDSGHTVVIAGRENHSDAEVFRHAYHYSITKDACFASDISLFINSSISLIGGSGIGILAAVFKKPFVMNNIATYTFPQSVYGCVSLPSFVYSRSLDRYLSVAEIESLWDNLPNSWEVPADKYSSCTRSGNPYSNLFRTSNLNVDVGASNKYLVDAVKMAFDIENHAPCKEVNHATRYRNSQSRYPTSYVSLLKSEGMLTI
jgi:hypothetical protein